MSAIEKIKAQWSLLSEKDKRVIRFYREMELDQILQRIQNFADMMMRDKNSKRKKELQHQVDLYSIAYLLKEHKIHVKGGGKTRRRKSRRQKQTRRGRV